VFNDTELGGASRNSLAAGERAGTGAIAFHLSRYHGHGLLHVEKYVEKYI
jgi:hypothetical protein